MARGGADRACTLRGTRARHRKREICSVEQKQVQRPVPCAGLPSVLGARWRCAPDRSAHHHGGAPEALDGVLGVKVAGMRTTPASAGFPW